MRRIIAKLFEHFTECYTVWNGPELAKYTNDPLDRLNAGDCGTAAIAVGWVLEQRYGVPVEYVDNQYHAYLRINGICYDTLQPEGQPNEDLMLGRYMNLSPVRTTDVRTMHHWFIQRDLRGYSMICEFCGLYAVKPYSLSDLRAEAYALPVTEEERNRTAMNIEKERAWRIIIDNDLSHLPKNEPLLLEWVEQREPRLDRVVVAEMKEFEGKWYLYVNRCRYTNPTGLLQYRRLNDILLSHMLM